MEIKEILPVMINLLKRIVLPLRPFGLLSKFSPARHPSLQTLLISPPILIILYNILL